MENMRKQYQETSEMNRELTSKVDTLQSQLNKKNKQFDEFLHKIRSLEVLSSSLKQSHGK